MSLPVHLRVEGSDSPICWVRCSWVLLSRTSDRARCRAMGHQPAEPNDQRYQ